MSITSAPLVSSDEPEAPVGPPAAGALRGIFHEVYELTVFSGRAVWSLTGAVRYTSEGLRHAAAMMSGTLPLLFVMSMFIGITQMNFAFFFLRSIGASDFSGAVSGFASPRVTATVMLGYVFTSKICCGIVAELGAMKISEEIDALDSTGVDHVEYVVGTRLFAALLWLPLGWIVALLGVQAGSYVDVVIVLHGVSGEAFTSLNWSVQTLGDSVRTLVVHFGIVLSCTIVACFYGLRTRGGPEAVGESVARSLIVNLVIVHVIAAVCGVLFYGTQSKLPFGG